MERKTRVLQLMSKNDAEKMRYEWKQKNKQNTGYNSLPATSYLKGGYRISTTVGEMLKGAEYSLDARTVPNSHSGGLFFVPLTHQQRDLVHYIKQTSYENINIAEFARRNGVSKQSVRQRYAVLIERGILPSLKCLSRAASQERSAEQEQKRGEKNAQKAKKEEERGKRQSVVLGLRLQGKGLIETAAITGYSRASVSSALERILKKHRNLRLRNRRSASEVEQFDAVHKEIMSAGITDRDLISKLLGGVTCQQIDNSRRRILKKESHSELF